MKYYKQTKEDKDVELFIDPIVENHDGLEEITEDEFNVLLAEKNALTVEDDILEQKNIITSTSWIWEKYNRNVLVLKTMTNDEFYTKYETEINEQENARLKIIELES